MLFQRYILKSISKPKEIFFYLYLTLAYDTIVLRFQTISPDFFMLENKIHMQTKKKQSVTIAIRLSMLFK